jgi:hypothetical protein
MSNVPGKDPARGRVGKPHLRRRRGGTRIAWSIQEDLSRDAGPKPSMVPQRRLAPGSGFMEPIIMLIQGDCRE